MATPIAINKTLTENQDVPLTGCFFGGKCHLFYTLNMISAKISYQHHDNFVPRKIAKVTAFATFGEILYLISEMGAYMTGGMTDGMKLATITSKVGIKIAITNARKLDPKRLENAMVDFFRTLWEMKLYKESLILVSEFLWNEDIKEILSLFPFFVIESKPSPRNKLNGLTEYTLDDIEVFEKLGQFLVFTRSQFSESHDSYLTHQMPAVETALFEYYAIFHQTRELDALMAEENSVISQAVTLFFNQFLAKRSLHPALAIYFAHTERIDEALKIWKTLNDADKENVRWAVEAGYTLQLVDDEDDLKSNLVWIKKRSRTAAIIAFLRPNVDISLAMDWIKQNAQEFSVRFYDYLLNNNLLKPELVKNALDSYTDLLSIVGAPEFKADHAAFYEKYYQTWLKRSPRQNELDELDKYLIDQLIKCAMLNPKNLSKYCSIAKRLVKMDLMFTLFQIGEMYSEAAKEFILTWKADFAKIQKFCRQCKSPEKAFKVTIEVLAEEGYNIFGQHRQFILDNIEFISHEDIIKWIPDNQNIDDYIDFFISMEGKNLLKRNIMKMQEATIRQLNNEIDYKLTIQEVRCAEFGYTTVCGSCGRPVGSGFVCVAPDNTVYHLACKPKKLVNVQQENPV